MEHGPAQALPARALSPVVQLRNASLAHGPLATASSFYSPSRPYSVYGFCSSVAPGTLPPPGFSSRSRASSTSSSAGAGSTLPPTSTNGFPTSRPIPSALLRNGHTCLPSVYQLFTPRRTSTTNDKYKPRCPSILSLSQLNSTPWYLLFTRNRAGSNMCFKNFDLSHPCCSAAIASASRSRLFLLREDWRRR